MNNTIETKIELAKFECHGIIDGYDPDNMFKYLYPFTTENISGYIHSLNFINKSFLTVGSSLDQVINAALNGCQDVTVIDICPFVKEYYYLKMAAIETFDREEFIKFFCYQRYHKHTNYHAFNKKEYIKLRDAISEYDKESLMFLDALYKKYNSIRIRKRLFNYDELKVDRIISVNPYLNTNDEYNKVREKLKSLNINFLNGNIFNYNIDNTYDLINLSNIIDYHNKDNIKYLFNRMTNYLKDDGIMLVAYLYLVDKYKTCIDAPTYQDNLNWLFSILPKNIDLLSFESVNDKNNDKDTIVTYKKIKKL